MSIGVIGYHITPFYPLEHNIYVPRDPRIPWNIIVMYLIEMGHRLSYNPFQDNMLVPRGLRIHKNIFYHVKDLKGS